MSEHPHFDPAKGFVALPVEVMDLDLTPGAFRLLVELCRMANRDGYCWPSMAQLSDRLGRSKSAISGYLTDLRGAGLVETITQTTANGYNYRLKYHVTFWATWRQTLARPTPREAISSRSEKERRVQPAERMCDSQKHKHKNHSARGVETDLSDLALEWAACFRGAPYPAVGIPPDPALVTATTKAVARQDNTVISADISPHLAAFWHEVGVDIPPDTLTKQAGYLAEKQLSPAEIAPLLTHLRKAWKPHWRKPPNHQQFRDLVQAAKITPRAQVLKLLQGYLRRWHLAQALPAMSHPPAPRKKTWRSGAAAGNLTQNISMDINDGIRAV